MQCNKCNLRYLSLLVLSCDGIAEFPAPILRYTMVTKCFKWSFLYVGQFKLIKS